MEISRSVCGNETGYRYQLSLNAVEEPDAKTMAALIESAQHLSQIHLCDISISLPEYLDPDAAQLLAQFVSSDLVNMRLWVTLDKNPHPDYSLHSSLQSVSSSSRSQRDRTLREDYLLKQRKIKELQIEVSKIHHSIPGFRANQYNYHRSPLSADVPVGDCTPQELWLALMLNSGFNSFDPYQVAEDLYANRALWSGFAMLPNIDVMTSQEYPNLWRRGYLGFLPALNYRYHCDTLYIVAADDEHVFRLVDFGKEWKADSVQVYTGEEAERLLNERYDALPVLSYWWD